MKTLSVIIVALILSGCAQWQALDSSEKKVLVASAAVVVLLGAADVSTTGNPTPAFATDDRWRDPCAAGCR